MLIDKLKADSVAALKAGEKRRVEVLRYLISLIEKKGLQLPPGKMGEAEMVGVVRKELKDKEESKVMFADAGRNDLVAEIDEEVEIVKAYLPQEMGESELKEIVEKVVEEKGKVFGLVMKEVLIRVNGRIGGEVVAKIVKEVIEKQ